MIFFKTEALPDSGAYTLKGRKTDVRLVIFSENPPGRKRILAHFEGTPEVIGQLKPIKMSEYAAMHGTQNIKDMDKV